MFELVKTLAEEPAKRKKVVIFYVRAVLSSIVATQLFTYYFGSYIVLNPYDKDFFPSACEFFFSGNVLVVGFLYVTSYFLLFELLSTVPPLVLHYFTRSNSKKLQFDSGILGYSMKFYGVINLNKATREVTVGRNFDEFYNAILQYKNSTAKDEVYNYKHSLLFEVLTTYFIGMFVFYFITEIDFPIVLDFLFFTGFFVILLFYINTCFLINVFERNIDELITLLEAMKVEEIVDSSLELLNVTFTNGKRNSGVFFSKIISLGDKSVLLAYYGTALEVSSNYIKDALEGRNRLKADSIVLLAKEKATDKAERLIEENKQILTFDIFTNEADLKDKLKTHFFDR